jgi:hypothetical protein
MMAKQERGCDKAVETKRTREMERKSTAIDTHAKTVVM